MSVVENIPLSFENKWRVLTKLKHQNFNKQIIFNIQYLFTSPFKNCHSEAILAFFFIWCRLRKWNSAFSEDGIFLCKLDLIWEELQSYLILRGTIFLHKREEQDKLFKWKFAFYEVGIQYLKGTFWSRKFVNKLFHYT